MVTFYVDEKTGGYNLTLRKFIATLECYRKKRELTEIQGGGFQVRKLECSLFFGTWKFAGEGAGGRRPSPNFSPRAENDADSQAEEKSAPQIITTAFGAAHGGNWS
jgi:hypothetical protein